MNRYIQKDDRRYEIETYVRPDGMVNVWIFDVTDVKFTRIATEVPAHDLYNCITQLIQKL